MRRSKGCLGRIDLNESMADLPIETIWCRIDNDTQDSHNYNCFFLMTQEEFLRKHCIL